MKLLHVIPSLAKVKGGPTQILLETVKALREQGVETEIVTTNDNGAEILDVPLYQCVEYANVPVWFLPRAFLPMKEFIFSIELTRWLGQHLKDYDLVHTHYLFSYAPTCAAAIARQQKIPYLVTPYGMLTPWALKHQRHKKQVYSIIERHNLNQSVAIHCATAEEAEDVRNFQVSTPTFVIPYGVHLPTYQPQAKQKLRNIYNIPPEMPVVLFFSRLHPKKRPDLLLQALSKLATLNYDFHLILAGSGEPDYFTYLTNLVSSLGLGKRTSVPGFVTGQDKDVLIQGSDIFVLPSFSENFGIAVAEAMAAQLPVIVTPDVQISPDIAQAKAGLVIEGDVESLASAIAQLLTSPEYRQQLGKNGKRLVSHRYSWNAIASQFNGIYRSILNQQPLPELVASD
jgi:glycosyltransferase involved in cell wall biosynthesis